jgi:hypothetical protein
MKYRKKHFKIQKIKNKFRQNQLKLVFYFFFKIIIFLIILLTLQKTFKLKKIKKNSFEMKKNALKDEYFACFCTMGKQENLYSRELIEYYLKIGFGKFIFGDNNSPNTEKLSDVLQDYISNNIVDIIEIFGSPMSQSEFFTIVYNKYNKFCKWISFFDFDEYLEMHDESNKIIGIKEYLSNSIFDNCEAINFNWLIYPDNNLLHYDNRSLQERFPSPNYNDYANKFVKSIVRGNLTKVPYYNNTSSHKPESSLVHCDNEGNVINEYNPHCNEPPNFKYAYLKHYNTKTAEEYVQKIKRGDLCHRLYDIDERVQCFFSHNQFSEEKLKIFENAFNKSFQEKTGYYKSLYMKRNI